MNAFTIGTVVMGVIHKNNKLEGEPLLVVAAIVLVAHANKHIIK